MKTLDIPPQIRAAPPKSLAAPAQVRARILLVANQARYLKKAAEALEGEGFGVCTALDAAQALRQIIDHHPDMILIGKALRGMDGFTLGMHLNADPATRDMRIVAWTESDTTRTQQTAAAAGFDGHILKSMEDGMLGTDITRLLSVPAAPGPVNGFARTGRNVLIVDDNALGRELLAALLQTQGHATFEAENGTEALTLLEKQPIDAVISDVMMPSLDGYQLCHRIRGDVRFKDVPVIIYSGSLTSTSNETLAAELGAVRFLRKPAPAATITATLDEVFGEAEQRRKSALPAEPSAPDPNDGQRNLIRQLEEQTRHNHEVTGKLLQEHHDLLMLKRAFERNEDTLREKNSEYEEDLQLARETQLSLLPRTFPTFPRGTPPEESALRFHQRYEPKHSVSGDFFDVPIVSETKAGVFICDVMGHGVRAALITTVIRGIIEQLAAVIHDPGMVLTELNRVLVPILRGAGTPMFASAFYMVADAASGEIHFANAGHPSPLLIRRESGEIERLAIRGRAHGPALGFVEGVVYRSGSQDLAPHDFVMMFTDGIFEVDGPDEEPYGQERLVEAVRSRAGLPPAQIFDEVIEEIHRFSVREGFDDDVCLLGMEVDHLC